MTQQKNEEVGIWLDNEVTVAFLEGLDLRRQALKYNLASGAAYQAGNPYMSAELTAAFMSKIAELDYIIENPLDFLEREDEDESDRDTSSGPPPTGNT